MIKFILSLSLILLVYQTAYSVIIRHDKKIEEYTAYATQPKFDCVGNFNLIEKKEEGGSFVMLSPKYILTAAHCFINSDTRSELINMGDEKVTVYQPYNLRIAPIEDYEFILKGKFYKGKKITLHPKYFIDSNQNENYDLAIIELENPINDSILFPKIYNKFDEKGTIGTLVAFGTFGLGNSLQTEKMKLKIAGRNVIDSLGGEKYLNNYCKLVADFDAPNNTTMPNKLGSATPLNLEFGTSGGDSGGPLFLESTNNELHLIGIVSGGGITNENVKHNQFYSQIINWTRVSTFNKWIKNEISN